jgi:hypothetical protein
VAGHEIVVRTARPEAPPEPPRPLPVRLGGRLLERGTRKPLADV